MCGWVLLIQVNFFYWILKIFKNSFIVIQKDHMLLWVEWHFTRTIIVNLVNMAKVYNQTRIDLFLVHTVMWLLLLILASGKRTSIKIIQILCGAVVILVASSLTHEGNIWPVTGRVFIFPSNWHAKYVAKFTKIYINLKFTRKATIDHMKSRVINVVKCSRPSISSIYTKSNLQID